MIKYRPRKLEAFFREVDRELTEPCAIIVIRGAAVGLAYDSTHATKDVDLWNDPGKPFFDAVERVRRRTGMAIPIAPTPIAEPPESFEERLEDFRIKGLASLRILLPERHDLALMKAARGEDPDLQAILDIHKRDRLRLEVLIERYRETMPVGPRSRFRLKFLAMVALLFGEPVAEEIEKKLRKEGGML